MSIDLKKIFGIKQNGYADELYIYNKKEYILNSIDKLREENEKLKENKNMNEELLDKIVEAATFLYVKNMGDTVAPNILVSRLQNKSYYVSLNRYISPTDRYKKTIVYKTTCNSLNDALIDIAKFLSKQKTIKTNPLEELEKFFNDKKAIIPGIHNSGIHNW